MAQRLGNDNIPNIVKASSTSVTLAATNAGSGTLITIGGQQYSVSSTLTLNTGTVGAGGLDAGALAANSIYYVYAVLSANVPALVASLSVPATGPTGFTPFKAIGVFKTLSSSASIDVATGIDPTSPGVDSDRVNVFTNPTAFAGTNNYVPPGVMFDYAGSAAPSADWLMCDGSSYAVTAYPNLFAAIGYSYGGSGANFNVPDFRGRFARYNDNMGTGAAGRDTGRVHGSSQTDRSKDHIHGIGSHAHQWLFGGNGSNTWFTQKTLANAVSQTTWGDGTPSGGTSWGQGVAASGAGRALIEDFGSGRGAHYTQAGLDSSGNMANSSTQTDQSGETRPINLSCNKIIKV